MTIKKIAFILCLFFPLLTFAQNHKYYCEVTGTEKDLSNGMKIIFDFGTNPSYNFWGDLNAKLIFVDRDGSNIDFNTMVDAANFLSEKGWTFLQAYSSAHGERIVEHWIFCKEAATKEQAKEGIMTRGDWEKAHSGHAME